MAVQRNALAKRKNGKTIEFAVNQFVEIVTRALFPGVNDPVHGDGVCGPWELYCAAWLSETCRRLIDISPEGHAVSCWKRRTGVYRQQKNAALRALCRLIPDTDCGNVSYHSENTQQPNNDGNDDHDIEDFLDGGLHRDVGVDQPENYSNNDQDNDQLDEWHDVSPLFS
jgi:hypothetical protein